MDKSKDGSINFDEFLIGIRGKMNEVRQAIVDSVFSKIDVKGDGKINQEDVVTYYDISNHPKILSGGMTKEEVYASFFANFGDLNKDGSISKEVFV